MQGGWLKLPWVDLGEWDAIGCEGCHGVVKHCQNSYGESLGGVW